MCVGGGGGGRGYGPTYAVMIVLSLSCVLSRAYRPQRGRGHVSPWLYV